MIGITRTQVDARVYESIVLPNEPLVAVMHRDHMIGKDPHEVQVAELKDQPLIIPLRWQSLFTGDCRKLGFEPKILCVSDSIVQDLLLAKMGMGLAILPISSARFPSPPSTSSRCSARCSSGKAVSRNISIKNGGKGFSFLPSRYIVRIGYIRKIR